MGFQIPLTIQQASPSAGWAKYELVSSPFPDSGVSSRVLYTQHFLEGLAQINHWMSRFEQTQSAPFRGVKPLAVFGSLGVGKSHLLHYLEAGIGANPRTPVLRVNLTEQGMERIVLSDLLTRALPRVGNHNLVHAICASKNLKDAANHLGSSAPLRGPLLQIASLSDKKKRAEAVETLSNWTRRGHTTPRRRGELGLAGPMGREGEALHVVANLCTVARRLDVINGWYIFIDQLEELWRPGVITASRRSRLLTDMRLLADYALAGSPIAMLMAWNTKIDLDDTGKMLERDYRALWQRFDTPINIPMLSDKHVWPFAEQYLTMAGVTKEAKGPRSQLYKELKANEAQILEKLGAASSHSARKVLEVWRNMAKRLVE